MARPSRPPQTLSSGRPRAVGFPWQRAALSGSLLLAEYILISVSFTADALRMRGGWLSGLGLLDPLGAVALAAITASVLAAAGAAQTSGPAPMPLSWASPPLRRPLIAHAIAVALFFAVTAYVFGPAFVIARWPSAWVLAWIATGILVVTSAVAVAVPLTAMRDLVVRFSRPVAIGVIVGIVSSIAGRATAELWWVLNRFTFDATAALLRLAGQHVVASPADFTLGIDNYAVTIASSCAGYEGIGLIVVFLGAFIWLERDHLRFPSTWMLLPIGVGVVLAANVVRVATLIWIGRWVSPTIAEGSFHSKAGWVLYCAIALGTVAIARRSPLWIGERRAAPEDTWNPTATYLGPLLALLATALVTGLFTPGFDYLYPLRVIVVAVVLWRSRAILPLRLQRPSWEAIGFGVAVFALWMALEPPADATQVAAWHAQLDAMPGLARATWLAFRMVGAVLTVPVAEELAFRGFLLRRLISADFTEVSPRRFTWPSFLLSSLAFGALHQRWIAGTIAGCCYAVAQQRRGRLEDAVAAHAITNALIAADVLVVGAWWLWL